MTRQFQHRSEGEEEGREEGRGEIRGEGGEMREKRKFREGIRERGREVDDGVSCG